MYASHWSWNFVNLGNDKINIFQGQLLYWKYVRLVSMCQQGWMKNCEKKQESVNSRRRNDRDASTNTWDATAQILIYEARNIFCRQRLTRSCQVKVGLCASEKGDKEREGAT